MSALTPHGIGISKKLRRLLNIALNAVVIDICKYVN